MPPRPTSLGLDDGVIDPVDENSVTVVAGAAVNPSTQWVVCISLIFGAGAA
jgi:hypothetical protein